MTRRQFYESNSTGRLRFAKENEACLTCSMMNLNVANTCITEIVVSHLDYISHI